jgi:O-antigen/teichoic acid export membrane protein
MGLFGAALSLKTLILFVPTLVDNVGVTMLNSARGTGNALAFRQVLRINVLATGAVAATMALATVFLARPLISLFGADFAAGANVLRVLAFAACIQALANTLYQVVQSEGRMWFSLLAICIPRDALMVVLAFVLVPRSGAMGLAMAHAGAAVVGFVVLFWTTARFTLTSRLSAAGGRRA